MRGRSCVRLRIRVLPIWEWVADPMARLHCKNCVQADHRIAAAQMEILRRHSVIPQWTAEGPGSQSYKLRSPVPEHSIISETAGLQNLVGAGEGVGDMGGVMCVAANSDDFASQLPITL